MEGGQPKTSSFFSVKKSKGNFRMTSLEIGVLLWAMFYLPRSIESQGIITTAKIQQLPNNMFCRNHENFTTTSQVRCLSQCLLKENRHNCTAFRYEESTCECGRAFCLDNLWDDKSSSISVVVSDKCDSISPGELPGMKKLT